MKVHEITATHSQVFITLEPEHPSEVAICKLLESCEGKCDSSVEQPENGLLITLNVKTNRY